MPPRSRRPTPALAAAVTGLILLAAACSDTTGLPKAVIENTVDTVRLYALRDGDPQHPSAYLLQGKAPVRVDLSPLFDFAFDFDSLGRAVLLSTYAASPTFGRQSALQRTTAPFDSITIAPTGGWNFDSTVVVGPDSVVLVRGRPTTCVTGITVSLYAKLQVLGVDTAAKRLEFEITADENCGYRGLAPGLPTQ
jgi:hypothetical protein